MTFLGDGYRAGDRIPLLQYCVSGANVEGIPSYGPLVSIFRNPSLPEKAITAATAGGSLITVTCPSHGFSTGMRIQIRDVVGTYSPSPGINSAWTITVTGTNTFTLNDSATLVTGGTYTSSSGTAIPYFEFVANATLSPVDFLGRRGLFGFLFPLDGAIFTPGKHTIKYEALVGGYMNNEQDTFEVKAGGHSDAAVRSMGYWSRPEGAFVLAQLASGKVGTGFSPVVIPG